jgi:Flp pilus assembly protein TadD
MSFTLSDGMVECYYPTVRIPLVVLAAISVAVGTVAPACAGSLEALAAAEAGGLLFRAGNTPEAIRKFDEAIALDPGFEQARRGLAVALATRGQEQLRSGDFDEARADLERAVENAPSEAAYHLLLGVLYFRRGDLFEARQKTDRALELAPGLVEARELSGDIHYQQGSLEKARAEWEQAQAATGARGGHSLRAKLERVDRETAADAGFARDVSRHFTIQYDGPVPGEVARTALRLLEEAYDRLWRDFGRAPQHDIPVILYTRGLFDEITRSPGWVGGTYDGKIRIPVGGLQTRDDAERLEPILTHELTHAFVRANVPGRLPLWFEEGLAGYFQGTTTEAALHILRSDGGAFGGLEEVSAALRGGPRVSGAYAAAALAVAEMVHLDGFWLPRRILEMVAAGRQFPEAFRAAAGIDVPEFEQRWLQAQR